VDLRGAFLVSRSANISISVKVPDRPLKVAGFPISP